MDPQSKQRIAAARWHTYGLVLVGLVPTVVLAVTKIMILLGWY
jgi:hypothetical protein